MFKYTVGQRLVITNVDMDGHRGRTLHPTPQDIGRHCIVLMRHGLDSRHHYVVGFVCPDVWNLNDAISYGASVGSGLPELYADHYLRQMLELELSDKSHKFEDVVATIEGLRKAGCSRGRAWKSLEDSYTLNRDVMSRVMEMVYGNSPE